MCCESTMNQMTADTQLKRFLLNTFLDKSNEIVIITDSGNNLNDARVLGVNSLFELSTGLTQSKLINSHFVDWINLSVKQHNSLNIAFNDMTSLKIDLAVKNKDDNFTHIEFEVYPIKQTTKLWIWQGKLIKLEQQEASHSQQLIHQKEVSSVQQIVHDFNNILSVIMGNSDLVLEKMEVSSPFYPLLQSISRSVNKGTNLTKKLQMFTQKKAATEADIN